MKRVVLIDDSEIILDLVSHGLREAGYDVVALSDPKRFSEIHKLSPSLILLDINMPEVFGDDVAQFFKDEWNVSAPIYMFSDIDERDLKRRAQEGNADGYICKGWGMDRLLECVAKIIGTP